jgi:drug/metabolite transporter (DMT)-like permease
MDLFATVLFLTALAQLPFANVSAVLQALPLAVTLGAALVFRERVGWRRWLAIVIGFTGVMIIIRPGTAGFAPASVLVLLSVVFAAGRDLSTRALPPALPSLLVSAATALLITVFGFGAVTLSGNWMPLELHHIRTLSLASVFLFVGYQFIVLAMRTGEVAYVVPYRYTSLLWSILLGFVFFAEVPDSMTILGSAIVIAMCLFTLYRELVRTRQLRLSGLPR